MADTLSATIGELLQEAKDLSAFDLALLRAAAAALSRHSGCLTPAEEFVREQLLGYAVLGPGFQPDSRLEEDIESFRRSWHDIRRTVETYGPILATPKQPAEEKAV